MNEYKYTTGEVMHTNDIVNVASRRAKIEMIFAPQTVLSMDFDCFETGGFMLSFESGDCQVWSWTDEDLAFIERG